MGGFLRRGLLVLLASLPLLASAAPTAQQVVQHTVDQLLGDLRANKAAYKADPKTFYAALDRTLGPVVDSDGISRSIMTVKYSRGATPEQMWDALARLDLTRFLDPRWLPNQRWLRRAFYGLLPLVPGLVVWKAAVRGRAFERVMQDELLKICGLRDPTFAQLEADVEDVVNDAVRFAEESPKPPPEALYQNVYKEEST
jgi:hypothetical protein